jgi:hypothetical protein
MQLLLHHLMLLLIGQFLLLQIEPLRHRQRGWMVQLFKVRLLRKVQLLLQLVLLIFDVHRGTLLHRLLLLLLGRSVVQVLQGTAPFCVTLIFIAHEDLLDLPALYVEAEGITLDGSERDRLPLGAGGAISLVSVVMGRRLPCMAEDGLCLVCRRYATWRGGQ